MVDKLSPAGVVLLAVELAAKADLDRLAALASRHGDVLHKELLLRVILTYLPETVPSVEYVSLLKEVETGKYTSFENHSIDTAALPDLSDEAAARRIRKLRLLRLAPPNLAGVASEHDYLTQFLLHRAYRVDEEAGLVDQLPDLVSPFLDHSPYLRTWMTSVLLPWVRRNVEYYPQQSASQTLQDFEGLPDRAAVEVLLSQTGARQQELGYVGRDLRGMVGPWLQSNTRWRRNREPSPEAQLEGDSGVPNPGWDQVLQWLVRQTSSSWRVAIAAVEQWHGPSDLDLGRHGVSQSDEEGHQYMLESYARAALSVAYLIPEASTEALTGAYGAVSKVRVLLGGKPSSPLHTAAANLRPVTVKEDALRSANSRNLAWLRNAPLDSSNPLTSPTRAATDLLNGLALSAFLLTRGGAPCSMRRVAELFLLQDEREQKAEALKIIHAISSNGPKTEDTYWERVRNEVLWLRDWGVRESDDSNKTGCGVLSQLKREVLEVEMLKALLSNTRYALARSLYEDQVDPPLQKKALQDTIFAAALAAYDNASSPSRARGGVKKCDEIIHAFPKTIERSMPATQRMEALLKATHSLSDYRLVLKQGEPFTPVMLRIHSDPISIIAKVLEQNPKSYTRIQDMLDIGLSMVEAGLTVQDKSGHSALTAEQEPEQRSIAEKRITAMCIDAALTEDDFETAYSYVVNRLAAHSPQTKRKHPSSASPDKRQQSSVQDEWSWKAALQTGKYRRALSSASSSSAQNNSRRTTTNIHGVGGLGASANPEIRQLEQRIECLSTALRIAPAPTLQEILNAFRRCEEELDARVRADAEKEEEWDAQGDSAAGSGRMPGGFSREVSRVSLGGGGAGGVGGSARSKAKTGAEDAPMSLFDLSRASARAAQKNFTALSNLQQSIVARAPAASTAAAASETSGATDAQGQQQRARKRDQLREAAMGAMVSGVGWLVGAQPVAEKRDESD